MAEQGSSSSSLKLLSWNTDGLDSRDLEERTTSVLQTILLKQPDFVFLQEIVDASRSILEKKLKSRYNCLFPPNPPTHYFSAILVNKGTSAAVSGPLECLTFPGTSMGRQLLQLPMSYLGTDLQLMTSHLESMKDYSAERKAQLRTAFDVMTKREGERVCIFGGDLNLRDSEVKSVKMPRNVVDVWEACGAKAETKFTWDVSVNDNLDWPYPNRPKSRFDRIYLSPKDGSLQPRNFELVGQDRLHECGRFPSDHWGMWVEFGVGK